MSSVVHLEMEPYAGSIDLKDTALIIIDMQVRARPSAQWHCRSRNRLHIAILEEGLFGSWWLCRAIGKRRFHGGQGH